MNSKRFRFQQYIETLIGCNDLEKWKSYKHKFIDYKLSITEARVARIELNKDAIDLYYKSCFSLVKAINSIYYGYHSWAIVKLYYSIYYGMKAQLAIRNVGFAKNHGLFTWELSEGKSPVKVDGKKIRGDHAATIKAFKDALGENDVLQTNTIEGKCVYEWLMERRNDVNYRDRSFLEPIPDNFYPGLFDPEKFESFIESYLNDEVPIFCFDKDHCTLAAPIKRFVDLKEEFLEKSIDNPLEGRIIAVRNLLEPIAKDQNSGILYFCKYDD